jgi:hypothetical protein
MAAMVSLRSPGAPARINFVNMARYRGGSTVFLPKSVVD